MPGPMPHLDLTVADYPYGAPCWLDLLVTDVEGAQHFYAELFGWRWLAGEESTGGYPLALLDGHPVAGLSRRPPTAPVPSQWTTYLRVGDIDAAAGAIRTRGGRTLGNPVSLGDLARTLVARDPQGAWFGIWEPLELPGCGLLGEPGSLAWNELLTRGYPGALAFARSVFGHDFTDLTEADGPRWSVAHTDDGNPAFGLAEIGPEWDSSIPSHWVASFAVGGMGAAVETALRLGAALVQEPFDGPFGESAVLTGREGEVFGLLVPHDD
ncbi:MAG: Glyoxalase/bleomycin resistance protein/dioxygenase [Humibacillus sp.]|nr:Glyoxalase/bleomycin resistance protein/dioxygenase [Humibacillus sp.]